VGVAYDVNKKKFAQGCQGGTRRILKVDTLYYHFQQKNCIYTQLDGHAMVLLVACRDKDNYVRGKIFICNIDKF